MAVQTAGASKQDKTEISIIWIMELIGLSKMKKCLLVDTLINGADNSSMCELRHNR